MKKNPFTSYVMAFCVTAYWKMTVTWHISGIGGSGKQSMLSLPTLFFFLIYCRWPLEGRDSTGGGDG